MAVKRAKDARLFSNDASYAAILRLILMGLKIFATLPNALRRIQWKRGLPGPPYKVRINAGRSEDEGEVTEAFRKERAVLRNL